MFRKTIGFFREKKVWAKGPIRGNQLCWFGNLVYVVKDLEDPNKKLLQQYVMRHKKYGNVNVGERVAGKALHNWCVLCGVDSDNVNNMLARKTFVQTGLKDLQLPAQQVMEVTVSVFLFLKNGSTKIRP
mgnify:CR=1 FL=1